MSLMPWFDAWRVGAQAQQVMMLRIMRFWLRDASAGAEAMRMVSEKVAASAEAQVAAATALMKGQSAKTAATSGGNGRDRGCVAMTTF